MFSSPPAITRTACDSKDEVDVNNWEHDYSSLKINWFPGHMVKATKAIREKLKHVDMVFEIRDARVPFSSANADLDRIVGPNKPRLIVLNKSDLANQRLQRPVLDRFKAEGKEAIFVSGKSGTNVHDVLRWAKEQGAVRGEFSTIGSVAMIVGMPNVGKSSLINSLRQKATRARGSGENAEQIATIGASPGVTRHVSAFCISTNPSLYLVDTPGVLVPKIGTPTMGLRLALIRAVPEAAVPLDVLVGYMLRIVRARRPLRRSRLDSHVNSMKTSAAKNEAKLMKAGSNREPNIVEDDRDFDDDNANNAYNSITTWLRYGSFRPDVTPSPTLLETGEEGDRVTQTVRMDTLTARDRSEDDMEALLQQVEQESGAKGKVDHDVRRSICCRYLLTAFWEGKFGRVTLDNVLAESTPTSYIDFERETSRAGTGGDMRVRGAAKEDGRNRCSQEWLPLNLNRDWSSPSAWDIPKKGS